MDDSNFRVAITQLANLTDTIEVGLWAVDILKQRNAQLKELLHEVRPHIGDESQRQWPDDPEFDDMLKRVDEALDG